MCNKHEVMFNAKQEEMSIANPGHDIETFDKKKWHKVFRKLFTTSGSELWTLTIQVKSIFF